MDTALFWLLFNILTIGALAFYSMEEMAFVSFNKVRLQYYVAQNDRRAIWINRLLQNPSRLFVTTLIGVNIATFVGSECARNFHEAIGLSPDLAPLSQVILVIIFGELAPMFAARKYSEHVALLGAPLIYFSSLVLSPLIWLLGLISKASNKVFGGHESASTLFITQDELQKLLEEQEEEAPRTTENVEFNAITSNIFRLKEKLAYLVMTPLSESEIVSDEMTIRQLRKTKEITKKYLLIYHLNPENVTGIVYIKDLLRAPDGKKLRGFTLPPWFIGSSTPLLEILKQFLHNSENIGVVINSAGKAIGHITFEDLLDEIFGKTNAPVKSLSDQTIVHRTFNGQIALRDLNTETGIHLEGSPDETLSDWLMRILEHHPEAGESYSIPPYEFVVKETSLRGITSVEIQTHVN